MRTTLQTTRERFSGSSNNNYSQQQQRKVHLDAEICCAGRLFPLSCTVRTCMPWHVHLFTALSRTTAVESAVLR